MQVIGSRGCRSDVSNGFHLSCCRDIVIIGTEIARITQFVIIGNAVTAVYTEDFPEVAFLLSRQIIGFYQLISTVYKHFCIAPAQLIGPVFFIGIIPYPEGILISIPFSNRNRFRAIAITVIYIQVSTWSVLFSVVDMICTIDRMYVQIGRLPAPAEYYSYSLIVFQRGAKGISISLAGTFYHQCGITVFFDNEHSLLIIVKVTVSLYLTIAIGCTDNTLAAIFLYIDFCSTYYGIFYGSIKHFYGFAVLCPTSVAGQ
ncbi:hypothetical protein D3C80_1130930 [compost metagenome]